MKLPEESSAKKPELPHEWNISQDVCALQYRHEATQQSCLVKAIPMGETLLVSAVVSEDLLLGKYCVNEAFIIRWLLRWTGSLL